VKVEVVVPVAARLLGAWQLRGMEG